MQLYPSLQATLIRQAELSQRLTKQPPWDFLYGKGRYFDADGFQLNPLEQDYYSQNNIIVHECLGVQAAQYNWLMLECNQPNFILDHSFVVTRCCYTGEARQQLEEWSEDNPWLRKMLLLKPKWGLDFALEYYNEDNYVEVLHIERDYSSYREAQEQKEFLESSLISTDWENAAQNILKHQDKWLHLEGMARNDWKANYLGFGKAEHTLKAF
jgi:hypothetical protein